MHAQLQASLSLLNVFFILGVTHIARDAGTSFDTKYIKRHGSA